MKRSLLLSVFMTVLMFWAGYAFAQCTPDAGLTDPEGNGEMQPDTLEGWENVPMSTTLTIICPTSADVGGGSIPIHHITIKSITNQPGWMAYACNPGNCEYAAGVNQCALVTGTPPAGSADTILMDVLVDVYMNLGGTPVLAASNYSSGQALVLIIHPPASVQELSPNGFGIIAPQPNPFSNETRIGCYTAKPEPVSLSVHDMIGNTVFAETIYTASGENFFSFNGRDLNAGIYFYTLRNAQGDKITRKMVKAE